MHQYHWHAGFGCDRHHLRVLQSGGVIDQRGAHRYCLTGHVSTEGVDRHDKSFGGERFNRGDQTLDLLVHRNAGVLVVGRLAAHVDDLDAVFAKPRGQSHRRPGTVRVDVAVCRFRGAVDDPHQCDVAGADLDSPPTERVLERHDGLATVHGTRLAVGWVH